jgi:hypothetical protein
MKVYEVIVDIDHRYTVKGDMIDMYTENRIADILAYRSKGYSDTYTVAKINLDKVIAVFEVQSNEDNLPIPKFVEDKTYTEVEMRGDNE